ncbi:MAG: ATP-binding protein, partial [Myxococcota bacterium]
GRRLDNQGLQALNNIQQSSRRLQGLVDSLLLVAAGKETAARIHPRPCDIAVNIWQQIASWAPAAEQAGITLSYEGPARLAAQVDEAAIERIVANLVSNAVKFTPDGGNVDVLLVDQSGKLELAVRDTGVGMDEEFRQRMFGRFEQGPEAVHAVQKGSGLGLSIVRDLVEAHGGTIDVRSEPGQGSTFSIHMPTVVSPDDALRRAPMQPIVIPQQAVVRTVAPLALAQTVETIECLGTTNGTVLVAEDDPHLRHAIGDMLADDYRVVLAPDGAQALEAAKKHLPDILVSDIGMPEIDGLELTRLFRKLDGTRLAPVLLLTAYGTVSDKLLGFEAGAVDYVHKPFDPAELKARIRAQLALREMALRLSDSEKLASLGTLAAGLAHEVRNPANALVNAVEPLREALPRELLRPGEPAAELLDVIQTSAAQIGRLSRQLLGFRRPGEIAGDQESIEGLISRSLAMVKPVMEQVRVRQELAYRGSVW